MDVYWEDMLDRLQEEPGNWALVTMGPGTRRAHLRLHEAHLASNLFPTCYLLCQLPTSLHICHLKSQSDELCAPPTICHQYNLLSVICH